MLNGMQDMKIAKFGGLNTLVNPTNLPVWASPNCQDVEFFPGLVKTRPGLTVEIGNLGGGTVKVNYLKTYINSLLQHRMLALTPGIANLSNSGGVLYKETPQGTMNIVSQTINSNYCDSCSAFTREYLAFGDGQFGIDIPRQFDDTNLDRVSQEGPGAAPSVQDDKNSSAILAPPTGASRLTPFNILSISESGNVVTVTVGSGLMYNNKAGDTVLIAGVPVGGYNGTQTLTSVAQDFTSFTYTLVATGLAPSAGGTCQVSMYQIITATSTGLLPGTGVNGSLLTSNGIVLPNVTISGVGVAGYNGTWQVRTVIGGGSTLVVNIVGQFALAASGNGSLVVSGNIASGLRSVSVVFVTRSGYITQPAPPTSWTAGGNFRAFVSNIAVGPPNVVSRILIFTALQGQNFFYLPDSSAIYSGKMIIPDNTSTTAYIDFTDELLLAGTVADDFFDQVVLGESAGNIVYSSRLFWWGERNQLQNMLSMSFEGGFTNPGSLPNFPLGWIQDATFSPGGASAAAQGYPTYYGDAYAIVGNGATPTRGKITQTLVKDYLGNPIVSINTGYSVRVRLARNSTLAAGTVHINALSTVGGIATTGISIPFSSLATWYQEFTAVLLPSQTSIPPDLVLQVYADGTPTNNGAFLIDSIEVYPTNQPFTDASTVRVSGVENPESYNGVTGFLQVAQGDGTRVTAAAVLRNNLYFAKERSLYVTQDGTNEPSAWTIQPISDKVGTLSVKGIGSGDEWFVIAAQDGLYLFSGSIPQKISQEIQPTWDSINWQYGYLVEVVVDIRRKRIYVSAPFGSSTTQNKILTLDYTEGFAEQQDGIGRKWSPWAITAGSMNLILRDDATLPLFIGNGAGNGAIYELDENGFSDDGAPIDSFWQTGFFQDGERLNFGYISANVVGSGTCNLTLYKGGLDNLTQIRGWTLRTNETFNMERFIQKQAIRMSMKLGTNSAGDNFNLQSLVMYVTPSVYGPVRGINA